MGEAQPCNCWAYDAEHNAHNIDEHTSCGGIIHGGTLPCGGCDDCVGRQVLSALMRQLAPPIERWEAGEPVQPHDGPTYETRITDSTHTGQRDCCGVCAAEQPAGCSCGEPGCYGLGSI